MLSDKLRKKVQKRTLTKTDIDRCKDENLADVIREITNTTTLAGLRLAEKAGIDPDLPPATKEFMEQFVAKATDYQLMMLRDYRNEKVYKECSADFLREVLYECIAED